MNTKNIDDKFYFKTLYTNSMTVEDIFDFIKVKNQVLSKNFDINSFETKFKSNPFGASIIVLAYTEEHCIGSRVFWRNDLKRDRSYITAYQPCDTAVIEDYRGQGIFTKMTELALSELDISTAIYNFPNGNSIQGNYKLGWELISHLKYTIFNYKKHIDNLDELDKVYVKWLAESINQQDTQKLFYMKRKGKYFLLKKRNKYVYVIISLINEADISHLKLNRIKLPIYLIYAKNGKIGRGLTTVGRNLDEIDKVPFFKMDTLF